MDQKLAFVCSEFNKDLVRALYEDARGAFEAWRSSQKPLPSSQKEPAIAPALGERPAGLRASFDKAPLSAKRAGSSPRAFQADWKAEKILVPGAAEIPQAIQWLLSGGHCQAVLALGVIIRGETAHFDFLCGFLQKALWSLQKNSLQPLVFSILMTQTRLQAEQRIKQSRGAKDMKSLLQMIELKESL